MEGCLHPSSSGGSLPLSSWTRNTITVKGTAAKARNQKGGNIVTVKIIMHVQRQWSIRRRSMGGCVAMASLVPSSGRRNDGGDGGEAGRSR